MKIQAIQTYNYNQVYISNTQEKDSASPEQNQTNFVSLYNTTGLTFGIANSAKLRTLFSYGLPCMYTGVEMIDPRRVQRLIKDGKLRGVSADVIKAMTPFENNLAEIEGRVYSAIKAQSAGTPDKDFKQILETISPVYKKRLRKKQAGIFKELKENAYELPEGYKYKFDKLMEETDLKLQDKPVWQPFSTFEFKYKLEKIKDDINKRCGYKEQKVINKMLKEAEKLTPDTNVRTEDYQKGVMTFLKIILKTSVLKQDEQLNNLIDSSTSRLNHEKVKIPFSRKAFIYDLAKILDKLPDQRLGDRLFTIASKLPTSRESVSAYVLKYLTEPPEKIAYRLLWPTFASVEHILPKSCGGADAMSNFGGATTRENAERGNYSFVYQMKRRPHTKENCQKYVDRLIELANQGVFDKNKIDKKYIEDFKRTILKQSNGAIVLEGKYEG